jgi:hypothetical protein
MRGCSSSVVDIIDLTTRTVGGTKLQWTTDARPDGKGAMIDSELIFRLNPLA